MHVYSYWITDDGAKTLRIIQVSQDVLIVIVTQATDNIMTPSDGNIDKQGNKTILAEVLGMDHMPMSSWSVSGNTYSVTVFIQNVSMCTYDSLPTDKA